MKTWILVLILILLTGMLIGSRIERRMQGSILTEYEKTIVELREMNQSMTNDIAIRDELIRELLTGQGGPKPKGEKPWPKKEKLQVAI